MLPRTFKCVQRMKKSTASKTFWFFTQKDIRFFSCCAITQCIRNEIYDASINSFAQPHKLVRCYSVSVYFGIDQFSTWGLSQLWIMCEENTGNTLQSPETHSHTHTSQKYIYIEKERWKEKKKGIKRER